MVYNPLHCLPTSVELPDSDDTPVDVDMGIYHTPNELPLVPDGFLSLGVERFIGEKGRLIYVLWEEDNVVPLWALEVVSKTYRRWA